MLILRSFILSKLKLFVNINYYLLTFLDCNKVLLVYGLTNLAKMEEESLDKMDPYQRGATDISEYNLHMIH